MIISAIFGISRGKNLQHCAKRNLRHAARAGKLVVSLLVALMALFSSIAIVYLVPDETAACVLCVVLLLLSLVHFAFFIRRCSRLFDCLYQLKQSGRLEDAANDLCSRKRVCLPDEGILLGERYCILLRYRAILPYRQIAWLYLSHSDIINSDAGAHLVIRTYQGERYTLRSFGTLFRYEGRLDRAEQLLSVRCPQALEGYGHRNHDKYRQRVREYQSN